MSLRPISLVTRGLTFLMVGVLLLLLAGIADQPSMRRVVVAVNDEFATRQWNMDIVEASAIRAWDAWDDEWQFAADEGQHGFAYPYNESTGAETGPLLARYGTYAAGGKWVYKLQSRDFVCGIAGFNGTDPAPWYQKRCEIAPYWINAVGEGDTINVTPGVPTWVRYGYGTSWAYAKLNQPATCGMSTFGGRDPARMILKTCQIQSRPWGGVIANEDQLFNIPGNLPGVSRLTEKSVMVRYGWNLSRVYRLVSPGTIGRCGIAFFGQGDPAPGVEKHCEIVTTMGAGVTIAVLDVGQVDHPDQQDKVVRGVNTFDGSKSNKDDCALGHPFRAHAIGVGSIAAATTNNRIGIAGVAPGAKLVYIKTVGNCYVNSRDEADAEAIRWAAGLPTTMRTAPNDNPARVIMFASGSLDHPCSQDLKDAVKAATEAGSYVLASAGNQGKDLNRSYPGNSPGNCPGVAVVGAVDRKGRRLYDSNFGDVVALSAPGEDILAHEESAAGDPAIASTTGTSAATPQVAGTVALVLGANPSLTPQNAAFRVRLNSRAFPQPWQCSGCGMGMLDADATIDSSWTRTKEDEPNDEYDQNDYVKTSADVEGVLQPAVPVESVCTVAQPCCKNQSDTVCPQPAMQPDRDWYLLNLPPGETLRTWIQTPDVCPLDCYFDIRPVGEPAVQYQFGRLGQYTNNNERHRQVFIKVHSGTKPVLAGYQINIMWRPEPFNTGRVMTFHPELR